jgi:hypothetical protein
LLLSYSGIDQLNGIHRQAANVCAKPFRFIKGKACTARYTCDISMPEYGNPHFSHHKGSGG